MITFISVNLKWSCLGSTYVIFLHAISAAPAIIYFSYNMTVIAKLYPLPCQENNAKTIKVLFSLVNWYCSLGNLYPAKLAVWGLKQVFSFCDFCKWKTFPNYHHKWPINYLQVNCKGYVIIFKLANFSSWQPRTKFINLTLIINWRHHLNMLTPYPFVDNLQWMSLATALSFLATLFHVFNSFCVSLPDIWGGKNSR